MIVKLAVYAIFENKDEQILMVKRANTGWMDGRWSLPSGHVEIDSLEDPLMAARREVYEEVAIDVDDFELNCVHVMTRYTSATLCYVDYFYEYNWTSEFEAKNAEPEKASAVAYIDESTLSDDEIVPSVRIALEHIRKQRQFSYFNSVTTN